MHFADTTWRPVKPATLDFTKTLQLTHTSEANMHKSALSHTDGHKYPLTIPC